MLPMHLLITDIRMPVINGLELVTDVSKYFPNIKIILMTAYGIPDYFKQSFDFSKYPKLMKPFTLSDLLHHVENDESKDYSSKSSLLFYGI